MRLPKYYNPHLAVDATRTVSRKTLQNDAGDEVESGERAGDVGLGQHEVEGLQVKLEEIVSKRLKLKRVLTPSDEPRSKKRRELSVEEAEGQLVGREQTSEPVGEFKSSHSPQASHKSLPKLFVSYRNHCRLVPSICPRNLPRPRCESSDVLADLSRRFTQLTVLSVKEPPCEDTEEELKERTYRSALSAVNLEQISHTFPMVRISSLANQIPNSDTRICLSRWTSGNHRDRLKRPLGRIRPLLRSYSWRSLGFCPFLYHG